MQVTTDQLLHEIGSLHVQVALLRDRVAKLQEANTTLTAELRGTRNGTQPHPSDPSRVTTVPLNGESAHHERKANSDGT